MNGNTINSNVFDASTNAYLADAWYAPTAKSTHKVYSLPQFQASDPMNVYGNS